MTTLNQSVTALQAKIVGLKLQINQLESRFTSEYRELVDSKSELEAAQKELAREMQKQKERLSQELAVLTARRNNLDKTVQDYRSRADQLASKAAQYERLREALASAQSIYDAEQKRVVSAAMPRNWRPCPCWSAAFDAPSMPRGQEPRKLVAGIQYWWWSWRDGDGPGVRVPGRPLLTTRSRARQRRAVPRRAGAGPVPKIGGPVVIRLQVTIDMTKNSTKSDRRADRRNQPAGTC